MTVTALIPAHSRPLMEIAVASLRRHAPTIRPLVLATHPSCVGVLSVTVPALPGGAANHAHALQYARQLPRDREGYAITMIRGADIIICLDDDTMILSDQFLPTLLRAFEDPKVGAWGAAGIRDPLHPSCIAFRRELFDRVTTFESALPDHDTTGLAQAEIQTLGYRLVAVPAVRSADGWDVFGDLWAHLGGGVIHAPVSPLRRAWRHLKAAAGSEAARDLIVKAKMRERWLDHYDLSSTRL